MITWGDVKLTTFQKMFSADGDSIPTDSSARDYEAAMPSAANEALQMLATAGKFIIKIVNIAHNPVKNLLTGADIIKSMERGTLTFEADKVRSIYFEYYGVGSLDVSVDGTSVKTLDLSSKQGYAPVRFLVENEDDKKVVMTITSRYPIALKNVAMYSADFESNEEVPTYAEKVRYNLKELVDDFYMLSTEDVYYEGGADISRYVRTQDYFQEGNTVLVLDRDTPGNFRIYYKAYPQQITKDTPDDTVLVIDPEVGALMPLYMASQIYKEDDNAIATAYRNEFEVAFGRLRDSVNTPSAERFTSESGWV